MEPAGSTFVLSSASARRLLEDRWSNPVIVSYAQNAEDVRLARLFDSSSGFYVDVGAGDPTEFSVTKHFYDRGWAGINVEPGPAFERLEQQRPRDVNLRLAVAPESGEREFWVSTPHWGLSTLSPPTHRRRFPKASGSSDSRSRPNRCRTSSASTPPTRRSTS